MKLIENSIDADKLQTSISHADLEDNMASCDLETMNSSDQSKKESSVQKTTLEPKLSNGICSNTLNHNGYLVDTCDDDFQLVLESSSEEGSPGKKMYDDAITAPRIVQEIKDLLGIDAQSVGIDEELDKDITVLDNNSEKEDITEENQLTNVVLHNTHVSKEEESSKQEKTETVSSKEENKDSNCEINKTCEETECDSSSNMNLVYDEVEIGTCSMEVSDEDGVMNSSKNISQPTANIEVLDKESENNKEVNIIKESEKNTNQGKEVEKNKENQLDVNRKEKVENTISEENEAEEQDVHQTSQSTITSGSSPEWLVLDSIVSEEESSENQEKSIKNEDLTKSNNTLLESTKSDLAETKDQLKEEDMTDQCSSAPTSTGIHRKRSASGGEEKLEEKKLKLDHSENDLKMNCSQDLEKSSEPTLKGSNISESDNNNSNFKKGDEIKDDESNKMELCEDVKPDVKPEKEKSEDDSENVENVMKKTKTIDVGEELAILSNENENAKKSVLGTEVDKLGSSVNVPESDVDKPIALNKEGLGNTINEEQTMELDEDNSAEKVPVQSSESSSTNSCDVPSLKCDKDQNETDSKKSTVLITKDNKEVSEENKENIELPGCSKEVSNDENRLESDSTSKSAVTEKKQKALNEEEDKKNQNQGSKLLDIISSDEDPKTTDASKKFTIDDKDVSSKTKEVKVKYNGQIKDDVLKPLKSPFEMLSKNMIKKTDQKQMTNLDKAIEDVVTQARKHDVSTHLPILKKFHKSQLRRLTRSQLEELVVVKVCEAITDRSEIGQMRLRCKTLEQGIELWKKKVSQCEKQNREMEMVLKRFMNETMQLKKDNQNKVVLPIKVTRSVGLQVVLASAVHGSFSSLSSRKVNTELVPKYTNRTPSHHQQNQNQQNQNQQNQNQKNQSQQSQFQPIQPKPVPESQTQKNYASPPQPPSNHKRGRPMKLPQNSSTSSSNVTPAVTTSSLKITPSTPVKTPVPTKTISTPTKDLEVIDLTDREEKAKATPPQQSTTPVGAAIRVTPSTQVCFVQSNTPNTSTTQMAYLVQKTGQKQQYLVTTASTSPPRPVGNISTRPPAALSLPVFRAGGQIIPVQTSTSVGVRTSNNSVVNAARPIPPAIRVQSPISSLKHPAPLPASPPHVARPGLKAPPPKPQLKIAKTVNGIMLSWSMPITKDIADMAVYQLYAYQEGIQPPSTNLWKKVGDVKALPLPMACTLTQFIEGHKYHFAVRAVDVHNRAGPFSQPNTILLSK